GMDVTVVSWGAMIRESLEAAGQLESEGIECEVVDLATLKPFDSQLVLESVGRTGRCVIVQEASLTGGFASEVAATIAEEGLMNLLAPVKRVAGYDTVVPLARLEGRYMPSTARIVDAVREVMEYS
ncbi:MAG TPA: transketolase C-terminal domain-containing protein, partial [Afifellaceae bacterium]|nr:transketolase C-terminal domain-containing protein [Afifellaceae bacterium]